MFNIGEYLSRFNNFGQKEILLRKICKEVFNVVLGVSLDEESFIYKKGILEIKTQIKFKTEIFIKKQKILDEINKKSPLIIKDIKF